MNDRPRPRLLLLLLISAAIVYFAGSVTTPLWDRDEPRYAQCSRQMLESGDWVVPRLYDEPRAAKPPLIYWCQASAMQFVAAAGMDRWMSEPQVFAARLPSTLAMLLTIILLYWCLRRGVGEQHALWTLVVFSTSLLTIWCAKICLTDSVQLLFIVVAQVCLYLLWRGYRNWPMVVALGVALGAGGLTKGPFIAGIVAMTGVALGVMGHFFGAVTTPSPRRLMSVRSWAFLLRALLVVLIVVAMVAPWFYEVHRHDPGFIARMVKELGKHVGKGGEGHSFPPGYHLLLIWVTFLPWSLLLPVALVLGYMHRRDPVRRFALAAVVGPWVMIECMGTKLPHYELAMFPALSLLTADVIVAAIRPRSLREYVLANPRSEGFLFAAGAWAIVLLLLSLGSLLLLSKLRHERVPGIPWGWGWLFAAVLALYAIVTFVCFAARQPRTSVQIMGGGAWLLALLLFGFYLPNAGFLQLSPQIAASLRSIGAVKLGQVEMCDYKEPSLAFYQGGTIREAPSEFKSKLVTKGHVDLWPPFLVITDQVWRNTPPAMRSRLQILDRRRGLAISDGMRVLDVIVVEADRSGFTRRDEPTATSDNTR